MSQDRSESRNEEPAPSNKAVEAIKSELLGIRIKRLSHLWAMAQEGRLDEYLCPGSDESRVAELSVSFDAGKLRIDARPKEKLLESPEEVDFSQRDFLSRVEKIVGKKVVFAPAVDDFDRAKISLDISGDAESVPIIQLPSKRQGLLSYFAFDSESLVKQIGSERGLSQNLKKGVSLLCLYLKYAAGKSSEEIPNADISIEPPADFVPAAERKKSKKTAGTQRSAEKPVVTGRKVLGMGSDGEVILCQPRTPLDIIEGMPEVIRVLEREAEILSPAGNTRAAYQRFLRASRRFLVLHGDDEDSATLDNLVEGLSTEAGTNFIEFSAKSLLLPVSAQDVFDAVVALANKKGALKKKRIILHVKDGEKLNKIGFQENDLHYGKTEAVNPVPMFMNWIQRENLDWQILTVVTTADRNKVSTDLIGIASEVVGCEVTVEGIKQIIGNTIQQIEKRINVSFRVNSLDLVVQEIADKCQKNLSVFLVKALVEKTLGVVLKAGRKEKNKYPVSVGNFSGVLAKYLRRRSQFD